MIWQYVSWTGRQPPAAVTMGASEDAVCSDCQRWPSQYSAKPQLCKQPLGGDSPTAASIAGASSSSICEAVLQNCSLENLQPQQSCDLPGCGCGFVLPAPGAQNPLLTLAEFQVQLLGPFAARGPWCRQWGLRLSSSLTFSTSSQPALSSQPSEPWHKFQATDLDFWSRDAQEYD